MNPTQIENALIVDDDGDVLNQMSRMLLKLGVLKVTSFLSAQEAIESLKTEKYGLALLDLRLPQVTGTALIQVIRDNADPDVRAIPILAIVGVADASEDALLQELDLENFLAKPFTDVDFEKRIVSFLSALDDSSSEDFILNRVKILLDKGEISEAKILLEPLVANQAENSRVQLAYGRLLLYGNNLDKASEILLNLIIAKKELVPALGLLAKVRMKQANYGDALKLMDKAQKVSPLNLQRLVAMGELNLSADRSGLAEDNFRKALSVYPDSEAAKVGLCRSLIAQDRVREGRAVLKSLQNPEEMSSFFNMRAIILTKAGRFKEGIAMYENTLNALMENKKKHLILYNIALAHTKNESFDDASKALDEAMLCAPEGFEKGVRLKEMLVKQMSATSLSKKSASESAMSATNGKKDDFMLTQDQLSFLLGTGLASQKDDLAEKQINSSKCLGIDDEATSEKFDFDSVMKKLRNT